MCLRCKNSGLDKPPCSCRPPRGGMQRLYGLANYDGEWRKLLHRLKYHSKPQLAPDLGRYLGVMLRQNSLFKTPDVVTSIPLHPQKQKERGYNQSLLLARRLARELETSFQPLLCRTNNTESQTSLSRQERLLNVRGVFALSRRYLQYDLQGKSILLVDDIYTTGATMGEAAGVLDEAGARQVNGAVLAVQRVRF